MAAKVQIYFELGKKKCTLLCIFNIKARFARMGFGSNEQRESANSIRKNANEVHEVNCFRKEGNFFREVVLRKSLFVVWELCRRSLSRLSVFSRWNMARYKRR